MYTYAIGKQTRGLLPRAVTLDVTLSVAVQEEKANVDL
jgi:hypothetical protein